MRNHELAMLAYSKLARISHEKQQFIGRDRFLILAGQSACRAGWLEIAEQCRDLVLRSNPRHLLSRADSFPAAIRDSDNDGFFSQVESFCPFEQAEHLLRLNDCWDELEVADSGANLATAELNAIGPG